MKVRTRISVGFASICLLLMTGCATANLNVRKGIPSPMPTKVAVKIESAQSVEISRDALDSFRNMVTTSLFQKGFEVVSASGSSDSPPIMLTGQVAVYDPGNRFMRWFLPAGLGMFGGYFDSTWTVLDASGKELGNAQINGSVHFGGFGGDFDDVLQEGAERVADFLTRKTL